MFLLWKREKQELITRIIHIKRIRGFNDSNIRDRILEEAFISRIRGICRTYGIDEKKILENINLFPVSDNGCLLEKQIEKFIDTCYLKHPP